MTERSTMKSYAKTTQVLLNASASIDFKDSANNAIECNYFSVDCRSSHTSDHGYFIVQPSGIYSVDLDGRTGADSASSLGSHTTAGIGGVIGTADGSVEMSLASKTPGVIIFNKLREIDGGSSKAIFVVTYGNMKQANPRRDQDDTFYPPGS